MMLSSCICRLKPVWGEDADEWKPERFIEGSVEGMQKTRLGVVANLYGVLFFWCVYANVVMVAVQHSAVAYVVVLGNVHITSWHNPSDPNATDMILDGDLRTSQVHYLNFALPDVMVLNDHSMIEMQAILIELLENIEFLPPPGNIEIMRCATGLLTPM